MPVMIEVKIEGGEEARQLLSNIGTKLPIIASNKLRKTANNVLNDLKREMDFSFAAPRGELKSRTRMEHKGFLHYDISMPKYGDYVDTGTYPHNVSKPYLFKPWQRKTKVRSLSSAIHYKGTKPTHFITRTKQTHLPKRINEFANEFLVDLKKAAKAKGGI